jgi:cytoskeletal protein CcmA (bactofilin family)
VFNRDALFGKKGDTPRLDTRGTVNVTPGLNNIATAASRQQAPAETPKPDLRFTQSSRASPHAEDRLASRLVVGRDIKVTGAEISDCDTLIVEGRVEASMESRVMHISETGIFSGAASVDSAEIRGRFEGELTVREHLVVHATGRINGRIRYAKIKIEDGGEICGEITTLHAVEATASTVLTPSERNESNVGSPVTAPALAESELSGSLLPAGKPVSPVLGSRQKNQTRRGAGI